jgi:predicted house-cleaning noncanonical NTP pyrophosphatase (MazG superfamily)
VRREYDKLIRDRVPEVIAADGKTYEIKVMGEQEYLQALLTKLVEEAEEAAAATPDNRVTELADVLEVLEAICGAEGVELATVRAMKAQRREQRGGFDKRLKLLWTE